MCEWSFIAVSRRQLRLSPPWCLDSWRSSSTSMLCHFDGSMVNSFIWTVSCRLSAICKQHPYLAIYLSKEDCPSPHCHQFHRLVCLTRPRSQTIATTTSPSSNQKPLYLSLYLLPYKNKTMSLPSSSNQPHPNTTYSTTAAPAAATSSSTSNTTTAQRTNQTTDAIRPSRTSATERATNPDQGPDSGLENGGLSRAEAERLYEERMEEEYAKREGGA